MEIDTKKDLVKYEAELEAFTVQMKAMNEQRAILAQAIAERRGIVAYLNSLNGSTKVMDAKVAGDEPK